MFLDMAINTNKCYFLGIENPRVDSSILSPATNKYKGLVFTKPFFICERDKNVTIRTRYRQFKSQSYLLHLQDAQLQT